MMYAQSFEDVSIGSFACLAGDAERDAHSISEFDQLWGAVAPGADFDTMGCNSFREMSAPVEDYVVDCVKQTLAKHKVEPMEVDHIVFSMMDATLGLLGEDFVARVLDSIGMVGCIPAVLSYQQCCGSLAALTYGWQLFADEEVQNVLVVSLDFRSEDKDRVRSFALLGDAVTTCMIGRRPDQGFRLLASSVGVDHDGMMGRDSFGSRQKVARASLEKASRAAGVPIADVVRVFPTNLFKPLAQFNAAAAGIEKGKLHFSDTLERYGHCGNSDWMMNLVDYERSVGIGVGEPYLALASAPGFFACSLLVALAPPAPPVAGGALDRGALGGVEIVVDDLSGPEVNAFIAAHIREIEAVMPPESRHTLDIHHLRMPDVTVKTVIEAGEVIGCGAIKRLDADHGEIKSMRVAPSRRRRGLASMLLRHLLIEAKRMGLSRLSLETGSFEFFEPARRLYLSHGFEFCDAFAGYEQDPNSIFMTKAL
jgi:N-acetylglutamate synthase-like GNAT family acetyltransferase